MTEAEWMTSNDPAAMLRSLVSRFSAMKRRGETPDLERLRFFACACCRRIWDLFDEDHRKSIELIEAYCSAPTHNGLRAARRIRWAAGNRASNEVTRVSRAVPCDRAACLAAWARNVASSAVWQAADKNPAKAANCHREVAEAVHSIELANGATSDGPDPGFIGYKLPSGGELIAQAALLRELIGNRPKKVPAEDDDEADGAETKNPAARP